MMNAFRLCPLPPKSGQPCSRVVVCLLGIVFSGGPLVAQEDRLPGYYPTYEEVDLLGGPSRAMYGRHLGGTNIGGPDAGSLTASGIWHQDSDPTNSVFEDNDCLFSPLDGSLGWLAPGEVLLMESNTPTRSRLYGYVDPGLPFTRDFNPDLATMKMGPFYLDLISLTGILLYSDYSGSGRAGEDDGWISSVALDFRGFGRLTQNLYLTMSGSVYVLPHSGEVGFYFGDGRSSFARLAYEGHIGDWNYVLFDEFRAMHPLSQILDEVEVNEIDQAGRYRFGRFDSNRDDGYFDSDAFFFINTIGAAITGPLGRDFEAAFSAEHFDYWDTASFDHVRNWDRLRARVEYSGMDWWLIPYAEYRLTAVEDWDILHHTMWLGARARVSENLRADARVGYYMSTGSSSDTKQPIGEIGLIHNLGPDTTHSFFAGVRHHIWENADDLLASYARYTIAHNFGSRIRANAYTQYSKLDGQDGSTNDRDGWMIGGNVTARVSDYTEATVGVVYDNWDHSNSISDRDRLIFRASITQRLLPYLQGRFLYQYEDYDTSGNADYTEHLYMLSLRYLF